MVDLNEGAASASGISWMDGDGPWISCPICSVESSTHKVLKAPFAASAQQAFGDVVLFRCDACGGGVFDLSEAANYAASPPGGPAALAFYLQQGAGLHGIARNLLRLRRPAGSTLLEIGCGFGFGLDFAQRALGWDVSGYDPSPFALKGRELLSLPIESRIFTPADDLNRRFDVVFASELLEHVPEPRQLVATLRGVLQQGGVLALTTPDMASVRPDMSPGALTPLLSAGYHMTLQTEESLGALLHSVGFAHVEVERCGPSLLARASDAPLAIDGDADVDGRLFRAYLDAAMARTLTGSDLWLGFAARAYRWMVAAGDFRGADRVWASLAHACTERFGFLPGAGVRPAAGSTLEALVDAEPLCLGGILLARAYHRLGLGASRSEVEMVFLAAQDASTRLRTALNAIGTDDGDAEDIYWTAGAEAALCAAEQGRTEALDRFLRLGTSPTGGAASTESFRRRLFTSLVNAANFDAALSIADTVAPGLEQRALEPSPLRDDEADALYCAATLELQRKGGDAGLALRRLTVLRRNCIGGSLPRDVSRVSWRLLVPVMRASALARRKLQLTASGNDRS